MTAEPSGADRTVLFADLAGFTALTEAHGDLDAADVAARFGELAARALVGDARLVKTIGDAVMIVAAEPAATIHTGVTLVHLVEAEPRFLGVRVGVHAGPVIHRDGDVFGATVNLAARLAAQAPIGQVLTTETVARAVQEVGGLVVRALGQISFRNVSEPVKVFAVAGADREPAGLTHDPVCQMLVDPAEAPARLPHAGRSWFFCSMECARKFADHPQRYSNVELQ
jgi:adenylate cyclase